MDSVKNSSDFDVYKYLNAEGSESVKKDENKEIVQAAPADELNLDDKTKVLMKLAQLMVEYRQKGRYNFWMDIGNVSFDAIRDEILNDDDIEVCAIKGKTIYVTMTKSPRKWSTED